MRDLLAKSSEYIIGVDEVGLGAWAGPLVVGATVFKNDWAHKAVKDSKRYRTGEAGHKQRKGILRDIIKPNALFMAHSTASPEAIDKRGVAVAQEVCAVRAISECLMRFPGAAVVLDGDKVLNLANISVVYGEVFAIVGGDDIVPAVSAASILAKVNRDTHMKQLEKVYPGYKFAQNVGYGTTEHKQGLADLGPCPIHRMSYRPIQRYDKLWRNKTQQRSRHGMPD